MEYARTLMGRYRRLPDINHSSALRRGHAERAAINTPIQGGAADIVARAMVLIEQDYGLKRLGWRLLLQIHDEVILEGPQETSEEALCRVKQAMMYPFFQPLRVTLTVDAKIAQSWYAAK